MGQERIDPSLSSRCTDRLATRIQYLCLIHRNRILDVFRDLFKQARVNVVIMSAMLSMSFPDCVTVCEDKPNLCPLQVEDSSHDPGGHPFVKFAHRRPRERGFGACEIARSHTYRKN
jgi:hypothetical protein